MTSSLLIAKVLVPAVGVGGIAVAGGFALFSAQQTPTPSPAPSVKAVVVKGKSVSSGISTATLTAGSNTLNYKCKLSTAGASSSACTVIKLTTAANWIDITKIKFATQATPIESTDLKIETNYFKVEVDATLYEALTFSASTPTIEIVNETTPETKYGELIPLFNLSEDTPEYKHATHLLGKAQEATTNNKLADSGSKSRCSLETSPSGEGDECSIFSFGSTAVTDTPATQKYSTQSVSSLETKATDLVKDQYYLLKYTNSETTLTKAKLVDKTEAHISVVAASESPDWTNKGTLSELAPVIVDGSVAFILSTHISADQ